MSKMFFKVLLKNHQVSCEFDSFIKLKEKQT